MSLDCSVTHVFRLYRMPPDPVMQRTGAPGFRFPRRGRSFMFVGGRCGRATPCGRPPLITHTLDRTNWSSI